MEISIFQIPNTILITHKLIILLTAVEGGNFGSGVGVVGTTEFWLFLRGQPVPGPVIFCCSLFTWDEVIAILKICYKITLLK